MPLFVSMHFRFKLDINANFTAQHGEWVFIIVLFLLFLFNTQKAYLFTRYLIMPHIFGMIHKDNTAFRSCLVLRGNQVF